MRTGPTLRWGIVGGYVGFIYATIPVVPKLWLGLGHLTGIRLEPLALAILLSAAAVVSVPALIRPRWQTFIAMGLLALVYVAIYRLPFATAAERLHLLEYGVVPGLVAWALGRTRPLSKRLLAGALVGGAVGVGDEVLQGLTPGRFFQLSDIAMNAASAGLGAIAGSTIVSPLRRRHPDLRRSRGSLAE